MSLQAMHLVWQHSRHGGTKLLLMLAIADHCNDDLIAWPGQEHLAHKIRRSKRYTRLLLDELTADKNAELRVLTQGDGRGNSTRYQIILREKGGGRPPRLSHSEERGGPQHLLKKGEAGTEKGGGGHPKGGGPQQERGRRASPEPSLTLINRHIEPSPLTAGAEKNKNGESRSLAAALTETEIRFLELLGAERFKNAIQRAAVMQLEQTHGAARLLECAAWAAKHGMPLGRAIVSIEKAIPTWGEHREKANGRKKQSEPERNGIGHHAAPGRAGDADVVQRTDLASRIARELSGE